MRYTIRTRAILLLACAAVGLVGSGVRPTALAQVAPASVANTQVKTRDIIRANVGDIGRDSVAAAMQQSLQRADAQEQDPVIKGAIEQTLANPQVLADTVDRVERSLAMGDQSATAAVYAVDALGGTISVLNLQVTRVNAESGTAQPTQRDDLRSFINNQLAKDVGDAVLNTTRAKNPTLSAAADQSRKVLTDASVSANTTFDLSTNHGQTGDQQAAAQQAVTRTDQQVLASLGAIGPAPVQSAGTNSPGLCIVSPPGGTSALSAC